MISTDQKLDAFNIISKAIHQKKNAKQALIKAGFSSKDAIKYYTLRIKENNERRSGFIPVEPIVKEEGVIYSEHDQEATIESRGQVTTVDELIAIAKVDLNIWAIDHFVVNKWPMACKNDADDVIVTDLFQVKIWLKKKDNADTAQELRQWFIDEIASYTPTQTQSIKRINLSGKEKYYGLEICIFDLHLGKLVWSEETGGENYDSNEAVRVFKLAIDDLLEKAPLAKIDRILLPIGNDFFNVDGSDGMTTAGTKQDEDSRWQKSFRKGCALIIESIYKLASYADVEVVLVPGNHDTERSFYLGEVLAAKFSNHKNVHINNAPTLRKYFRYGQTLIGWTHGDKEAKGTLPLLLATEQKENWAETKFKEFHIGHLHSEIDKEIMGVKVRTISSLTSADAWHSAKGYVGQTRQAKAFLYHVDKGLEAQYYFSL